MSRLTTLLRDPVRVLAAGVGCAVLLTAGWLLRSTVSAAPTPVAVAAGGSGTAAGAEWRLRGMVAVEGVPSGGSVREAVPGAVFVVARFDYLSTNPELYCTLTLAGQEREWTAGFHTPFDDTVSAGCDGRPSGTGEAIFEIPAAAVGEVRGLQVASGDDALLLAGGVQ